MGVDPAPSARVASGPWNCLIPPRQRCAVQDSAATDISIRWLSFMSASHHPTDLHRRQQRLKKRTKLRARIAAGPASARAALEARILKTYSAFNIPQQAKPPVETV